MITACDPDQRPALTRPIDEAQQLPPEQAGSERGARQQPARLLLAYLVLVMGLGYLTYFADRGHPPANCWDESYHVPAAYKYREGLFFMEPHPPLGKLLIAAGAYWLDLNADRDWSVLGRQTQVRGIVAFDFRGVRLLPALCAWFGAGLWFLLLCRLLGDPHLALLSSALYLFDNALVTHFRTAMLDGFLYVGFLAALLCFADVWLRMVRTADRARPTRWRYALLGTIVGLSVSIKVTGLLLVLLPLFWWLRSQRQALGTPLTHASELMRDGLGCAAAFCAPLLVVICSCYYVHIALCTRIEPKLAPEFLVLDAKTAAARPWLKRSLDRYRHLLEQGQAARLEHFPLILALHLEYIGRHNKRVEKRAEHSPTEQGSSPVGWPLGRHPICFRYDPGGDVIAFTYLVPNPAVWIAGLLGLLMASLTALRGVVRPSAHADGEQQLMALLMMLYLAYMIVMCGIGRVMYLYHYFPALQLSLLMWCLGLRRYLDRPLRRLGVASLVALLALGCYAHFAPLSYSQPLSQAQFESRQWVGWWTLRSHGF